MILNNNNDKPLNDIKYLPACQHPAPCLEDIKSLDIERMSERLCSMSKSRIIREKLIGHQPPIVLVCSAQGELAGAGVGGDTLDISTQHNNAEQSIRREHSPISRHHVCSHFLPIINLRSGHYNSF